MALTPSFSVWQAAEQVLIPGIMAFNFDEWSNDYELNEDTLKIMADKGFISKKTISKLTSEIIKKELKGLSVAQGLMLQEAIETLKPKQRQVSPNEQNEAPERNSDGVESGDVTNPSTSRTDPVNIRQLARDKDLNDLLASLRPHGNPGDELWSSSD